MTTVVHFWELRGVLLWDQEGVQIIHYLTVEPHLVTLLWPVFGRLLVFLINFRMNSASMCVEIS